MKLFRAGNPKTNPHTRSKPTNQPPGAISPFSYLKGGEGGKKRRKKKKVRWRMGRPAGGQPTDHRHSQPGLHSPVSRLPDTPCAGAEWWMRSLWGEGVPSITRATPTLQAKRANNAVSPRRCSPVPALRMSQNIAQSSSREYAFPVSPSLSTLT